MTSRLDLSICVLTHNQPVLLPQCISACLGEIQRAQLSAEIIIIDNASAARYPQGLIAVSPMVRIIRNEQNLGFGAANNRAIRVSSGRVVLILNDDAILLPGSLPRMIASLDSDACIAAVGPKLLNSDRSLQRHFTNRRFPHIRGIICSIVALEDRLSSRPLTRRILTLDRNPEQSGETDHIAGACLLARRDALDRVGLFDESFYYWFEDTDLCYRLKKAGWGIVYVAGAEVIHYGSASIKKIEEWQRTGMFLKSLLLFYKKNRGAFMGLLLKLCLAFVLLYEASRIVVRDLIKGARKQDDSNDPVREYLGLVRLVFGGTA